MTRKVFNDAANQFARVRPLDRESSSFQVWKDCVEVFVSAAMTANPNFVPSRFRDACGL